MQCVTVEEAMECTGLDRETLYARLPHVEVGKRTHRFVLANVEAYLSIGWEHVEEMRASLERGKSGRVYFAEADGCDRIKIGWTSKEITERMGELQTGCPFRLNVIASMRGSMVTEGLAHARFAEFRILDSAEWFHATKKLRDYAAFMGKVCK